MTELEPVICHHAGAVLEGCIAFPDGPGPHPAVLVMHDAHGLGQQVRETALALAQRGFVALASDMYGGGILHSDSRSAGTSIAPLMADPHLLRARVIAWHDLLKARSEVDATRTAALGYCFGGQCVLELARSGADVALVVSYHGLLSTKLPAAPGAVKAHVAVYSGARDPYASLDNLDALRAEMIAAEAHWQITVFGDAYHAFTHQTEKPPVLAGLAYDPLADAVSWAGTLALLDVLAR